MENKPRFTPNPKLRLMALVRETLRHFYYALSTEKTSRNWTLKFIYFNDKIIPSRRSW